MKIVYLSGASIPSHTANSIQTMKMCQAMVQAGHDVELIIPRYPHAPSVVKEDDLWEYYGIRVRFPVRRLAWPRILGGDVFGGLAALYAMRAGADVVYGRHLPALAMTSMAGMPTICELHDIPRGTTGPFYFWMLTRRKGTYLLVVITEALRRDLASTYKGDFDEDDVLVAPDGVDLERFANVPDQEAIRRRMGLPLDRCIVGYAGHFYPGKGIEVIIRLVERHPDIFFLLVGGEEDTLRALRRWVEEKHIANVFLAGFVPNTDVPLYLGACDILLLPNQPRVQASGGGNIGKYTSPLKLFEYLASGKAIISSDLPVLREVLDPSVAWLVQPDDIEAWGDALEELCRNAEKRRALGLSAKLHARQYGWLTRAKKILSAFPAYDQGIA